MAPPNPPAQQDKFVHPDAGHAKKKYVVPFQHLEAAVLGGAC